MEKQVKKKLNLKIVRFMFKGNVRYLVLAAVFLVLAVLAAYVSPLVISFTVDSVIGSDQPYLPIPVDRWFGLIGDREYLRQNLYICALAFLAIALVNGISTHMWKKNVEKTGEGIAKRLRDGLYSHLQRVPYDYHKHASTGDLVQRCTSDVDVIRRFISVQLLQILRTLAMVAIACTIMFGLNVKMALVSVALLPFLCASSFIYFIKVRRQFQLSDEAEGQLSATLQENLTGVRVVRAFGQQQAEVEKFTRHNQDFRDKTYKLMRMLGLYWGGSDFAGYIQIALSLVVGVAMCVGGELTLGNLMVFTSYTAMLTWPVRQLGRVLAELGKATVSLGRLDDILSHPAEQEPGAQRSMPIRGRVEFKNVCFGYERPDDVLKDISFTAEPGQTVAILGSTGSGKTSLVQLMQRLYEPTSGSITIDGVDILDIDHECLRRSIGIVLQEPFLYSRTIMENIRIVDPEAADEEVFDAARTSSIHDVIMEFENGYGTVVGERGVTLSGGQKQRVAIARMLMQRAAIMIFDDSLSAVDTETDAAIREALRTRKSRSTTFIISHRITTLCQADKILVLEHGELVQHGTHAELIRQEGLYRRIASIQDMLEDELAREGGEAGV